VPLTNPRVKPQRVHYVPACVCYRGNVSTPAHLDTFGRILLMVYLESSTGVLGGKCVTNGAIITDLGVLICISRERKLHMVKNQWRTPIPKSFYQPA